MKHGNIITLEDHMKLSCWSSVYAFLGSCMGDDVEIFWISKRTSELKSGLIRTIRKNHSTGIALTVTSTDGMVFGLPISSVLVKS